MTRNEWTKAELVILREIFASEHSIPQQAHRLPRRNTQTIRVKGQTMGLVKTMPAPLHKLIGDLMADSVERSALQVARALKRKKKFCRDILGECVKAGSMHIPRFVGSNHEMVFKAGAGVNATRPPPTTQREYQLRRLAKIARDEGNLDSVPDDVLDEQYRNAAWWPMGDPVVAGAMRAMVQVGRVGL